VFFHRWIDRQICHVQMLDDEAKLDDVATAQLQDSSLTVGKKEALNLSFSA